MFTCDWCVSINLVCFCVSRFADCDRPVSHGFRQWLTSTLCSFLWSFLFLSLARKQCLPPALNKNSTHHCDFLRFSWAVKGHSQFCFCGPSWVSCVALWCALTPPLLKWLTEQKTHSKFANTQRDITNLAISDAVEENIWAAVKNKEYQEIPGTSKPSERGALIPPQYHRKLYHCNPSYTCILNNEIEYSWVILCTLCMYKETKGKIKEGRKK